MRLRITWGKGLNTDLLPSELAEGYCSGASNVRFRNGFAERLNGTSPIASLNADTFWLAPYYSTTPAIGVYLISSNDSQVQANDLDGTTTTLTRYTEGVDISTITRVGTTATLTTATNHGRTTGDTVSIWGALPTQYNGTYTITVTGLNTFTYTMASDPGASASPVGLYSYNGATSNFTATGVRPTGGDLNGVFLFNHPAHALYYWNGDTSTRLRKVPGSYQARASRVYKDYVVQLAPTMDGTAYPHRVLWSTSTEPGNVPSSFIAAATNDAGLQDIVRGGAMVDCLPLGDMNVIYHERGRTGMQYIGGNSVFRFFDLPGTDGLMNTDCVVDTPVGHVLLSNNLQVLVHTGGQCRNISAGRIEDLLTFSSSNKHFFVTRHNRQSEVWVFCFNQTAGTFKPTRAFIWNWVEDVWGVADFADDTPIGFATSAGYSEAGSTPISRLYAVTEDGALVEADYESSSTLFGAAYTSYVERSGLDLGAPDVVKNLQRSRWNINRAAGEVFSIQHGSSMTAGGTVTYATAANYTVGTTDYANSRATGGKYLAVKATWSQATGSVLRSTDLDVTPGGTR